MGRASNRKKSTTRAQRLGLARTQAIPRPILEMAQRFIAYHEAGHATVAEMVGLRVTEAWVDVRGRRVHGVVQYGLTEHAQAPWVEGDYFTPADAVDPEHRRHLYSRLVMAAAGMISEDEYGQRVGMRPPPDRVSDWPQIKGLVEVLCGVPNPDGASWTLDAAQAERLIAAAPAAAERILLAHWDAVCVLAEALMERGDLTGDEVRAVLEEAGGLGPAPILEPPIAV